METKESLQVGLAALQKSADEKVRVPASTKKMTMKI